MLTKSGNGWIEPKTNHVWPMKGVNSSRLARTFSMQPTLQARVQSPRHWLQAHVLSTSYRNYGTKCERKVPTNLPKISDKCALTRGNYRANRRIFRRNYPRKGRKRVP